MGVVKQKCGSESQAAKKSAYVDEEGKVQIKDLTKGGKDRTIVMGWLGHSKIGITLDLYNHTIPSLQEQAVEVIDDEDDDN